MLCSTNIYQSSFSLYCSEIFKVAFLADFQVLIPVANGCEEIDVITIVDILRRAKANVILASVGRSLKILGSNGTSFMADRTISTAAESTYDLIILPVSFLYLFDVD